MISRLRVTGPSLKSASVKAGSSWMRVPSGTSVPLTPPKPAPSLLDAGKTNSGDGAW